MKVEGNLLVVPKVGKSFGVFYEFYKLLFIVYNENLKTLERVNL